MIGETVSHYRITRELGSGGMGVVYEAVDTRLDRPVALKFLPSECTRDPHAKARFIHEAKAASALDHPNVCNIHEIDETADGQLFIVIIILGLLFRLFLLQTNLVFSDECAELWIVVLLAVQRIV